MAQAKKTIAHNVEIVTPILSYTDGAYKQASSHDTVTDFAKYVIEKNSGFGTADFKLSDKVKEEIVQGYRMRFSARHPKKTYAVIGSEYFDIETIDPTQRDKVKEKVEVGVEVALSFTSNEYGKLANDRPQYHKLIGKWRSDTSTYCSNRFKDLEKAAKDTVSGGAKKKRTANLSFAETVDKTVTDLKTKLAKCVANKTDSSANQEKFNKALAAFLAVWKA
jgi:hypothetical protein